MWRPACEVKRSPLPYLWRGHRPSPPSFVLCLCTSSSSPSSCYACVPPTPSCVYSPRHSQLLSEVRASAMLSALLPRAGKHPRHARTGGLVMASPMSPELRLKQFLHCGREQAIYTAGIDSRHLSQQYEPGVMTAVEGMVAEGKASDAVAHIVKAFSDGYCCHPESLVYLLAFCTRHKNACVRAAAYAAFKTVCRSPRNFFLFIKFSTDLASPNAGWGRGLRRVVTDWYLKQDTMELAQCVTRYRRMFFWTHKDIFSMIHIKAEDIGKKAIITYVLRGIKGAQEAFGNAPEAEAVLSYLQAVEDFKHSTDQQQATLLLELNGYGLEHVPMAMIKSLQVWLALVPRLPLDVLLENLPRLNRLRFLQGNSAMVTRVMQALNDQAAITECGLHPAQVLIALCRYKRSCEYSVYSRKRPSSNGHPNSKIMEALRQLLASSFKLLVPTGMRYLVAVDPNVARSSSQCHNCGHLPVAKAVAVTALSFTKAERDVSVMAFSSRVAHPVPLTKDMSLAQAVHKIQMIPQLTTDADLPMRWAETHGKKVDVFVQLTCVSQGMERAVAALQRYREALDLPHTKLVVLWLTSCPNPVTEVDDPSVLQVCHFDGSVPRVIEAFSRGAF